ncbi:MAG: SDR family NAD(P)-dependent oxidoreductase [Candidatus Omnitrophota bacterium]
MENKLKNKLKNKVAFITGASRGVGKAIAKTLGAYHMKLGLIARSEQQLKQVAESVNTAGSQAMALCCDLRNRQDIERAVYDFKQRFGTPDFLINNAGMGARSSWDDISLDRELDMMAVNYTAPIILIRSFLPDMIKRNKGQIININSISGMYASPYVGPYCASKTALLTYVTSLAHELENTNVKISSIIASAIDTDFLKNFKGINIKKQGKLLTPNFIANKVLSLIEHPKERLFVGNLPEIVAVKIASLHPLLFRRIIEARNPSPKDNGK